MFLCVRVTTAIVSWVFKYYLLAVEIDFNLRKISLWKQFYDNFSVLNYLYKKFQYDVLNNFSVKT